MESHLPHKQTSGSQFVCVICITEAILYSFSVHHFQHRMPVEREGPEVTVVDLMIVEHCLKELIFNSHYSTLVRDAFNCCSIHDNNLSFAYSGNLALNLHNEHHLTLDQIEQICFYSCYKCVHGLGAPLACTRPKQLHPLKSTNSSTYAPTGKSASLRRAVLEKEWTCPLQCPRSTAMILLWRKRSRDRPTE